MLTFTLEGQMPSGKGQIKTAVIHGRIMKYPNPRFKAWRVQAYQQLRAQRRGAEIIRVPAKVQVRYWPQDLLLRDVPGVMDALCHLLEYCPVCKKKNKECTIPAVQDDSLLHSWVWIRMPIDRERPRIEVTVVPEPLP